MNKLTIQRILYWISNTNFLGTAKATRYLSYLLIKKPKGKVFTENLHGFSLWLNPNEEANGLEHPLYYLGTYEKGTVHVIDAFLKKDDNFLDVGANIGYISLFAAQRNTNGKVYSFEASPTTYDLLLENIRDNNINNIVPFCVGLGNENTTALIFPDTIEHSKGSASMIRTNPASKGIEVIVKKWDDLPESQLTFAMLKLDVEGYEMNVLRGASKFLKKENAPAIIVECIADRGNQNYTASELFQFIKSINSYRIFKLEKSAARISKLVEIENEKGLPEHDNLFCFLPNHLSRIQHLIKS